MTQLQLLRIPVKADSVDRVQSWIRRLPERREEVLEALASEDILDEAVFIAEESEEYVLYFYSRSPDLAAAAGAFADSRLAIDVEVKALMQECLELNRARPLELLFAADSTDGSVR